MKSHCNARVVGSWHISESPTVSSGPTHDIHSSIILRKSLPRGSVVEQHFAGGQHFSGESVLFIFCSDDLNGNT